LKRFLIASTIARTVGVAANEKTRQGLKLLSQSILAPKYSVAANEKTRQGLKQGDMSPMRDVVLCRSERENPTGIETVW